MTLRNDDPRKILEAGDGIDGLRMGLKNIGSLPEACRGVSHTHNLACHHNGGRDVTVAGRRSQI